MNTNGNSKHRYELDLVINDNVSYGKAAKQIKPNSTVLEVGTATGYFTKHMKENLNCLVDGIDYDEELAKMAKEYTCEHFIRDLNTIEQWVDELTDQKYDYILLMDVLEHLLNPLVVLNALKSKLKTGGLIIISIPNMSHNTIVMEMLDGNFTYTETGLTDHSHIRMYTPRSFSNMLSYYGYAVINYEYTYMAPIDSVLKKDYFNYNLFQREVLLNKEEGHTFQGIFTVALEGESVDIGVNTNIGWDIFRWNFDEIEHRDYVYSFEENRVINVPVDAKTIKIYPTFRLRKFKLKIFIDGIEKYIINEHSSDLMRDNDNFMNVGDGYIEIRNDNSIKQIEVVLEYENIWDAKEIGRGEYMGNKEYNSLIDKIKNYDVVSFDIFDTIILRNVLEPRDIFRILDREVKSKYKISNFYDVRVECESKGRTSQNNYEVTFDEIYELIEKQIGEVAQEIKTREFELELEFMRINPFMSKVVDFALKEGKKVILISDMYLAKHHIEALIKKVGYDYDFDLYVSSELKASKHIGTLYSIVYDKYDYSKGKWLHIGDNKHSDYDNAKNFGVDAHHYEKVLSRSGYNTDVSIEDSIISAMQINKVYNGLDVSYWEKFGIENCSGLYYSSAVWLAGLLKGKDNIHFLSRDGHIPMVCHNLMRNYETDLPEGKYLYTSRLAYQIPALIKFDKNIAVDVLTQRSVMFGHTLSIREVIENVGLNPEDYSQFLNSFNLENLDTEVTDENLHYCRKFIAYIYDDIENELSKKLAVVKKYLEQEGFTDWENPSVFDIGWRCSIQHSINKILDVKTCGYYISTNEFTWPDVYSDTFGFLTDLGVPHHYNRIIKDNIMMLEFIYSSSEPSLKGFKEESGKVVPVFSNSDYTNQITDIFQNAAIEMVKEYLEMYEYTKGIDKYATLNKYLNFVKERNYEDVREFSKLHNNLGFSDKKKVYVEEYTPEEVQSDFDRIIEEIAYSQWRGAFYIKDRKLYEKVLSKVNTIVLDVSQNNKAALERRRVFSKRNLKKALRNPKKAYYVLKHRIRAKLKS